MKKFNIGMIEEYKKIDDLQVTVSRLLCGLNANSLSLDHYYVFENLIVNNWYDEALELLKDSSRSKGIDEVNKMALTLVFESALSTYNTLKS